MNVRAIKDDAVAAMALGDVRAALGFYRRIAAAEPHDPRWIMKVGESHRALGETASAVAAFRDAALAYKREGFDLKAVAACRVLLQLAPGDPEAKGLIDTLAPRTSLTPRGSFKPPLSSPPTKPPTAPVPTEITPRRRGPRAARAFVRR